MLIRIDYQAIKVFSSIKHKDYKMKLNRLEAHDRLLHLKKQHSSTIFQGAEDCLKRNPDSLFFQSRSPYVYIFAHPRTCDDGITKKMIWQPRLTKPKAQTNSYLFRAISNTDSIEVCWLLPPEEMWSQYKKGNVTEHEEVLWSISQFKTNREGLQAKDPEDLSDERANSIWQDLISSIRQEKMMKALYGI